MLDPWYLVKEQEDLAYEFDISVYEKILSVMSLPYYVSSN